MNHFEYHELVVLFVVYFALFISRILIIFEIMLKIFHTKIVSFFKIEKILTLYTGCKKRQYIWYCAR